MLASLLLALTPALEAPTEPPRSRTFQFTYAATVTGVAPGKTVRLWLPVPPSGGDQTVRIEKMPEGARVHYDPTADNHYLHIEKPAGADGTLPVEVVYQITRREVRGLTDTGDADTARLARALKADARVPLDGKPLDLIKGKTLPDDPMAKARVLYDVVDGHMTYDKSKPGWGQGDAVWACGSGFGNCTDFHALFISLVRSQKIPARFEIGFSLPEKRGQGDIAGYHCWAKFRPSEKGWVGVDISEADKNPKMKDYYFGNLTEDRVTFSKGRDLALVPAQKGPPLNFFVYPYAEVDGTPVPADKFQRKFAFKDLP